MSEDTCIRFYRAGDDAGASRVCLKTGDHGKDGTSFYKDDPDALARIYVDPYLRFEPELSLILENGEGVCGYALAAFDARRFFERYEREARPELCARFPAPVTSRETWTRLEHVYFEYHNPDYFCPEPYELYPSHLHIDLLPRAQGKGHGRMMIEKLIELLRGRNSPGVHLGMSALNERAYGFYRKLGFEELVRDGAGDDEAIYLGMRLSETV